ncbi:MAG: DUF6178 family protein [Myxococcota bacterium]
MAGPHSPTLLDADDLRALDDDPLVLEAREDAPVLIPALAPATFVRIARRLRDEKRLDILLPHATPEQLTSLMDLDGWVRDRIDIRRARVWLHAIAEFGTGDRPRGALADLMYEMDPEFWTVALAAGTMVADIAPDQDDSRDQIFASMGSLHTWETPDGYFIVGVPDDELGRSTLQTISRVFEDDLGEGRKLCLSIQALMTAEAEEDLLRFRNGRLAELGFVEWEQAMLLLRPLDHRVAATQEAMDFRHLSDVEGLEPAMRWRGPELLRRVMMRLEPAEHGLRTREFLLLVAEMMSAQRFDAGDEKLQERAIDQTQATISLGLELLGREAPKDTETEVFLAERVAAIGLRSVFRVGYGGLDKVRSAAMALHKSGRVSLGSPGSLLDRPWGPTIATLCQLFPELPLEKGKGTRPLTGLPDVARATIKVAEAGALAQLCFDPDGFGIDPVWLDRIDEPERLCMGDLLRTALVHARLPGAGPTMAPLTADDLAWAADNLLDARQLVGAIGREFAERCAALGIGEHQQALADNVLMRLHMELNGLERDLDGSVDLTRTTGLLTVQQVGMWLRMRHGDAPN